jgi:hypothetical protein
VLRGEGAPNARVDGLKACDKCNETGRREEARERGRESAKGGGRRGGGQG